jgi:acyl carrier protein
VAAVTNDISGQIRGLIAKRLQVREAGIAPAAALADLGADSIAMMDLLMDFESAFGIEIPDDEASKIRTVGEAIGAIEKLVLAKRSA